MILVQVFAQTQPVIMIHLRAVTVGISRITPTSKTPTLDSKQTLNSSLG